jgi:hypothetical protein
VIETYAQESYVNPHDLELLTLAEGPEEAVETLRRLLP